MTQGVLAQAGNAIYNAGVAVADATVAAVQWLGRTVSVIKDFVVEYASKALDYAAAFFSAAKDFVAQNSQAFTVIGVAVGVAVVGMALAKLLSKPSAAPAPAVPAAAVRA